MPESALATELKELHEYIRMFFELYVAWFTFFLPLLLGAMGWSFKACLNTHGKVVTVIPFYSMVTLFTIQLILAVIGTTVLQKGLREADLRAETLLEQMNKGDTSYTPNSPVPPALQSVLILMNATLVSNLIFWLIAARLMWVNRNRQLAGSSTSE
jgi:hypothetical protein